MIIVLKGADFSANSIGTVTIGGGDSGLSADTVSLLSNYTKSLTDTQKLAVQDFISGLKSTGIWSYIGNLYLPVLANDLTEVMFNVKTQVNDFASPDSTHYALQDGGLKCISSDYSPPTSSRIIVKLNASQLNHHVMVFPLSAYPDETFTEGIIYLSDHNANRTMKRAADGGTVNWLTNSSDGNGLIFDTTGTPQVNNDGQVLIGVDFLTDKPYGLNGTVAASRFTGGYRTTLEDNTYSDEKVHILTSINRGAKNNNYGLISLGTGIPADLLDTYGALAKTFMTDFGAI